MGGEEEEVFGCFGEGDSAEVDCEHWSIINMFDDLSSKVINVMTLRWVGAKLVYSALLIDIYVEVLLLYWDI